MEDRDDRTKDMLVCAVCGQEITAREPVVQGEDGTVAHARCVKQDQTPRRSAPQHITAWQS